MDLRFISRLFISGARRPRIAIDFLFQRFASVLFFWLVTGQLVQY
jgi:hypothetical protein